jgi:uncharacterized RDD family membrane protein YckC
MLCPTCNNELLSDAVYCSRCGTSIQRRRPQMRYAGFWRRVGATIIDVCLLSPLVLGVSSLVLPKPTPEEDVAVKQLASGRLTGAERRLVQTRFTERAVYLWELAFFLAAPYFVLLESSALRGTVGKHMLGLWVTDLNGRRIRPGRAAKRYLGRLVSAMPVWYGFAMAGLTSRKQTLHDVLAGTLVVIRDRGEDTDE